MHSSWPTTLRFGMVCGQLSLGVEAVEKPLELTLRVRGKSPSAAPNRHETEACSLFNRCRFFGEQPFCVSPFRPDRTNKLVNQFATDRFGPLDSGCSDFWIQMRVRVSDLFGGHRWRSVRQLDPVVEKFSFENVYFHDYSFSMVSFLALSSREAYKLIARIGEQPANVATTTQRLVILG